MGVFCHATHVYAGMAHCLSSVQGWIRVSTRIPFSLVRKFASKLAVIPSTWVISPEVKCCLQQSQSSSSNTKHLRSCAPAHNHELCNHGLKPFVSVMASSPEQVKRRENQIGDSTLLKFT
jgi:hypothetical protein